MKTKAPEAIINASGAFIQSEKGFFLLLKCVIVLFLTLSNIDFVFTE
jgi:hypothetical protein